MDEPQATQPTNDDFQALHEFFSARRGDGESEAEARTIVDRAKQEAAAILEAAGREARQRETHLTARIAAKQAEHDTLHKGIGEAKAAVKGSIPASERLRR